MELSEFTGTIKSMNFDTGFGFINCEQTEVIYGCDVFLHRNQFGNCCPGMNVRFSVEVVNAKPQAREVMELYEKKLCVTCNCENPKYKCPKCRMPYCSINCNKDHKVHCGIGQAMNIKSSHKIDQIVYKYPTPAPVRKSKPEVVNEFILTEDQTKILNNSQWVKNSMRSKRLRDHVLAVHLSDNRQQSLQIARLNPEFEEFIDQLYKEVTSSKTARTNETV